MRKSQRLNRKITTLRTRLVNQNEKIWRDIFLEFAKEIETDLKKGLTVEIDFSNFIKNLKRGLRLTRTRSVDRVLEWTKTLFGWKLEGSIIQAVRNENVEDWMKKNSTKKIKGLERATEQTIKNIVLEGQARGLNTNDITKNIADRVRGMSKWRAKTIAITETYSAVDQTTYSTAIEVGMKYKTWNHSGAGMDDRETHLVLDGKTIKIKEKFNVNGFSADYPHDPRLPPGEVINCHCFVTYE